MAARRSTSINFGNQRQRQRRAAQSARKALNSVGASVGRSTGMNATGRPGEMLLGAGTGSSGTSGK